MSVHNEVRVYIRARPTAQFAQDLIQYLPDEQVRKNKQGSRLLPLYSGSFLVVL